MDDMLVDAFDDLMQSACTPATVRAIEAGESPAGLWQAIVESGFTDALVSADLGGAGLSLAEVHGVLTAAGRHAVPLPFAQTVLARGWLALHGVQLPEGAIALAPFGVQVLEQGVTINRVAYGMVAEWVLAAVPGGAVLLPAAASVREADGIHGSLTAAMRWEDMAGTSRIEATGVRELAAVGHAALLSGAADRVLELTLNYAGERVQFGKAIGKFQAIQQDLSVMAEHTYATRMAAQMACQTSEVLPPSLLAASTILRAAASANLISAIGHAVHGAIGVTEEYDLQLCTRRLQQWRSDAGSENYWAGVVGEAALQSGDCALDFIRTGLFPATA